MSLSKEKPNPFAPLCIYCNEPWTPQMESDLQTSGGCDTCGYGATTYGEIRIVCDKCNRTVYTKEVNECD